MEDIRRVIAQAGRRLWLTDALRAFAVLLTVGLTGLILALAAERIFAWTFPWRTILIASGAGVAIVTIGWSVMARRKALAVARILDERAGLKETLSTALCMEREVDGWSRAVVETAGSVAKKVSVGDAISIDAPRMWPAPVAALLVFGLLWKFLPIFDVLNVKAAEVAKQQKLQAIVEVKTDLQEKQEKLREALAKAKVEFLDQKQPEGKGDEKKAEAPDQDPESLRREAVKKLTDLTEKLQTEKEGEKAAQVEAHKEAMRQLKQPGNGPLNEFSRSLARGDFNKAQEHLKQLAQKMADGSMSKEEKEAAKKQLEQMGEQLKQMAEQQSQVAKQLEKAGLDKKAAEELAKAAASNPEALKKAIDEMKNLSNQQKQEMLEMAKAAAKAAQKAGQMGEGMSKMAQGMTQDGLQQEGQAGMEQLDKELSESEMMQEDMQNLDAALEQAKSQLAELGECLGGESGKPGECNGKGKIGGWKPGESASKSNGSGGPGQSNGSPSPQAQAADFQYKKEKDKVDTKGGPIIGTRLVYGEQVKGESTEGFSEVVAAGSKEAAEAMESMQIPREYHDAVKHYFGRLQEKVKKNNPAPKSDAPAGK